MYLNKDNSIYMDKVFINAIIYTIDIKNRMYQAMGIKDGKIAVLGTNDEVMSFTGINTEISDLRGKCILPGFIDPYSSIPEDLLVNNGVSLYNYNNTDDYINIITRYIKNNDINIICCTGWKYEDEFRHRGQWINKIECNKPIVAIDYSNEVLLLNEEAIKHFKISDNTVSPVGGVIEIKLDDNDRKYAFLKGNAVNLIDTMTCYKVKDEDYEKCIMDYEKRMNSYGITTISIGNKEFREIPIITYRKLEERNMLTARIKCRVKILPSEICKKTVYVQTHEIKRNRILYQSELFDISIGEIDVDGRLELGLSYLFKPYRSIANYRDNEDDYRGKLMWHMIEFVEAIKMANRLDINMLINARGDYACKIAMDGIEYSARNNENHAYRNTINHLDLITRYYMRRMKLLNVNALIQPYWFYRENSANYYVVSGIGEERVQRLYPFKSLIDEGIITAASSDYYSKDKVNPIYAVGCAVCRNLYEFNSQGYLDKVNMNDSKYMLNPSEKVTVFEAIKAMTINSAYILGMEKEVGSIELGKKADFIVLDYDIFKVHPLQIKDIKVNRTYLNGNLVYINE